MHVRGRATRSGPPTYHPTVGGLSLLQLAETMHHSFIPGPAHGRGLRLILLAAGLASACGGKTGAAPGAGGFAMPVEAVTLAERPVEQATEYLGTIKSRRSTTVQPQVEGFVTKILVRSGDRVGPGTPLMQIDAGMQRAAVQSLDSIRASRASDLRLAQQQAARMKTLFDAGASSQAELEAAQSALANAQAQLNAAEALAQQQKVALGYHQVTAPTAGVIGDVPVRVGDSVTRSTVLTTIDEKAGLEVYLGVPVQEAQRLKVGTPVRIVDDRGQVLASTTLSFVSPSVDPGTQSVLAKATLDDAAQFRTEQLVRARVVWTEAPALTAPLTALNRVSGQYFAFVAEAGEGGATVARQRAVQVGPIVGNDYVITSGLKAGDKLIVSGVQKIRDGAPVQVGAPAAAQSGAGK
jgi:RND family efflux transporter MFP subunit